MPYPISNVVSGTSYELANDSSPELGADLSVAGHSVVSVSNGNITLAPDGTGNVVAGTLTFDGDQTVGSGQDNYVLTYDHSAGTVALEPSQGGGFAVGTIVQSPSAPSDGGTWLECDGSAVSQSTYSSLYSAIGHTQMTFSRTEVVIDDVDFRKMQLGWTGSNYLAHSYDESKFFYSSNGTSWTASTGTGIAARQWASDGTTVIAVPYASDTANVRSTDDGQTWSSGGAFNASVQHFIGADPTGSAGYFLVTNATNTSVESSTNGTTWTNHASVLPAVPYGAPFWTGSAWLVPISYHSIARTTTADGSSGWSEKVCAFSSSAAQTTGSWFAKVGSTIFYFGGLFLYKSTNDGVDWTLVPQNAEYAQNSGIIPITSSVGLYLRQNVLLDMIDTSGKQHTLHSTSGVFYFSMTQTYSSINCPNNPIHPTDLVFFGNGASNTGCFYKMAPNCTVASEFCLPDYSATATAWIKAA